MRTITVNDHSLTIRALTPKEKRELKAAGFPIHRFGIDFDRLNDPKLADRLFDAIYQILFSPEQIQIILDFEPKEEREIFLAVVAETYGSQDEEKN